MSELCNLTRVKIEENCALLHRLSEGVTVKFCRQHFGHAEEPALLSTDKDSERRIVELLKEGFTANQILKKIRIEFKNKEKNRLYYITSKDIRNIATRDNVEPGRKHVLDLISVEIRVGEGSEDDGIRLYIPAKEESGDGFLLNWLLSLSPMNGISVYPEPISCPTDEIFELFSIIKGLIADFDPKLFMTDDTNSFFDGFLRALPESTSVKLLCCFHVLQAIKRNCRAKLVDVRKDQKGVVSSRISLVSYINSYRIRDVSLTEKTYWNGNKKIRSLCRSADHDDFNQKHSAFLTYLKQLGANHMFSYMEEDWSRRVNQWGGFSRLNACTNTSMLGERFHKRLKHELPDSKPNMRLDRLLEILISLPTEMDEDRRIKVLREILRSFNAVLKVFSLQMERGLIGGRYRLSPSPARRRR
ncbi:hypothetical protein OSTOST_02891 [Ostertagia ostertagi]